MEPVRREILLAFWKVHILHHAGLRPIYGQWMIEELRRRRFDISPGSLYPILSRMEEHGWLRASLAPGAGPKARRELTLTPRGASALRQLRRQVAALYREVVVEASSGPGPKPGGA
jgi:PadR family transcriptional regulator, regulatory protein PadR